ncbi:MAG: VWA domain-containing protein [Shewanella fodinae]|nr:VWA domain-containing protein [Shewanella fodinae]
MTNYAMKHMMEDDRKGFGFDCDVVLKRSSVDAQLNGAISEVKLMHEFVNRETCPIEAVFSFALPLDAVILGLTMTVGERQLTGEIVPKQAGTDKYEDAIAQGDSAVLLEQINDGLYSLNVGNLLPDDEVSVIIQYAQVLNWQDRKLRFYFPCTIGQRYGNQYASGFQPHQQIEHSLDNGARLNFNLTINGELASSLVKCPSHSLVRYKEALSLSLSGTNLIPDRDIIITLEAMQSYTGEILFEHSDFGIQYCANLLLPEPESCSDAPQCFQFVIDCSGSMDGDSIEQVRKALVAIKTLLRPSDWFNIVSFGSHARSLFPSPVPADGRHLAQLDSFLRQLSANMGGTEIGDALTLARKTGRHPELATQMLLITDGEVWDTETIVDEAKKAQIRLFSVGVGSAVNEAFLSNLSQSTAATAIFVSPNESMADAIVGHFKRSRQTEIKNIKVKWPMPVEEQANRNLCFTGDGYQRYAKPKMSASSLQHECVTIEINHLQDRKCILIPVREFQGIGAGTLSRLAAYQRLSTSQSPEKVAIEYGLLCEQTSCVLVAVREIKAKGLPALRTIRHTRPAGEAGFGLAALQPALYSISPQYFCSELDCVEAPSCIPKEPISPVLDFEDTGDSDVNEG